MEKEKEGFVIYGEVASKILGMEQVDFGYVSERVAAKFLGLASQTMSNLRHLQKGPSYVKLRGGRAVRYSVRDLIEFMEQRKIGTLDQPRE